MMASQMLLGLVDQKAHHGEATDSTISKLGGSPDGLNSDREFICAKCQQRLLLVVQVYCPLAGSSYHRTLYLFACVNKLCWNDSWVVIRSQIPAKELDNKHSDDWTTQTAADQWGESQAVGMETTDWCDDADDWGDGAIETDNLDIGDSNVIKCRLDETNINGKTEVDDVVAQMQTVNMHDDVENHSATSDSETCIAEKDLEEKVQSLLKSNSESISTSSDISVEISKRGDVTFESYYLSVVEESYYTAEQFKHENKLLNEYAKREKVDVRDLMESTCGAKGSKGGSRSSEAYEKMTARHGDKLFEKFLKKVSLCPQQVMRYCWEGEPLFIRKPNFTRPPKCEVCGAERVFEFQIMPSLVLNLKIPDHKGTVLEFGTVLVYSCSSSCWDESASERKEFCVVQADPDQHLFR